MDDLLELQNLLTEPGNFIKVLKDTGICIALGEALIPLFFFISLCWNYVETWIKEGHKGQFYNPAELKRTIAVAVLIPFMPAIFSMIYLIANICAGFFEMDITEKASSVNILFKKITSITEAESFNFFSFSTANLFDLLSSANLFFSMIFMVIIKFVVRLFSVVFIKYLIVVSPLAAVFSLIPAFKDQVLKILSVFCNVCFVALTINILDNIFFNSLITSAINKYDYNGFGSLYNKIVLSSICFTMIILYLLSIWLTSKYVGSPGAAAVLGMATTIATIAVAAAAKGFAGGVGGGGNSSDDSSDSDANNSKSVAEVGANAIRET